MCSGIPIIFYYWYVSCYSQSLSNEIPILADVRVKSGIQLSSIIGMYLDRTPNHYAMKYQYWQMLTEVGIPLVSYW